VAPAPEHLDAQRGAVGTQLLGRRVLPMPGSPASMTERPWPAIASSRASLSSAISRWQQNRLAEPLVEWVSGPHHVLEHSGSVPSLDVNDHDVSLWSLLETDNFLIYA